MTVSHAVHPCNVQQLHILRSKVADAPLQIMQLVEEENVLVLCTEQTRKVAKPGLQKRHIYYKRDERVRKEPNSI